MCPDRPDGYHSGFLRGVRRGETVAEQLENALSNNLLTDAQARCIREYGNMRYDVLLTDDFSKEYMIDPLSESAREAEGRTADLRRAS